MSKDYNKAMEDEFKKFLRVTDELFPKAKICESYFYGCHLPNLIPSIEGLNYLAKILKKRNKIGTVKAIPIDELEKNLKGILKKANKGNTFEETFLIWHGSLKERKENKFKVEKHITPIIVKVDKGVVKIAILDSVLKQGDKSYYLTVENEIKRIIPSDNKSKVMIYQLSSKTKYTARQRDNISCPIFSMYDLEVEYADKNFFKNIECRSELKEKNSCGNIEEWEIQRLPLNFMKNIQSLTALEEYLEVEKKSTNNDNNEPISGNEINDLLQAFQPTSTEETTIQPAKKVSNRARILALNYFNEIINASIGLSK